MTEELTEEVEAAVRNEVDEEEIRDTDIAFDCPQCGKNLVIDYDSRQAFRAGQEVKLTQTEYNIVSLLSEHCGKMMTYAAIIKAVWGYPDEGSVKKLQVNMANIRKKFGSKPGEDNYIINEIGVGYRMNSEKR